MPPLCSGSRIRSRVNRDEQYICSPPRFLVRTKSAQLLKRIGTRVSQLSSSKLRLTADPCTTDRKKGQQHLGAPFGRPSSAQARCCGLRREFRSRGVLRFASVLGCCCVRRRLQKNKVGRIVPLGLSALFGSSMPPAKVSAAQRESNAFRLLWWACEASCCL